jgi:hypothetical protein
MRRAWIVLALFIHLAVPTASLQAQSDGQNPVGTASDEQDLEEIDRKLNNPLTSLWSLTFQENYSLLDGDLLTGTEYANTFFFQPALPLPVGRDKIFIARPVFPLVTSPVFDGEGGVNKHTTGFGDIQVFTALGPNRTDGTVWGVGATFKFPTASNDLLGEGKYQVGPTFMYFYLGKQWTLGTLVQHWWSVAGDSNRPSTNHTDIQYVARKRFPGAMSIGMGPTISIDWEADSGNRLTLPIALGVTKTVRLGKLPVKLRLEPQYSIIRPDDLGTEWNIRLQISPVIASPF